MSAEERLIEAMAKAMHERWGAEGGSGLELALDDARVALAAAVSLQVEEPCETCDDGLIWYGTDEHGGADPCPDCTDGTRKSGSVLATYLIERGTLKPATSIRAYLGATSEQCWVNPATPVYRLGNGEQT
jgi:hypothetical protein